MALKAIVRKATLNVADMDRSCYGEHSLTLAQHPSETDERLMVRLLVFALNASDELCFTRGLSTDDEPDIWEKNLSDEINLWIELGLPDEDRLRKACNRARRVRVYAYRGRTVGPWWERLSKRTSRFGNLEIFALPNQATQKLAGMVDKGMALQVTVQDGQVGVGNEKDHLMLEPKRLYPK